MFVFFLSIHLFTWLYIYNLTINSHLSQAIETNLENNIIITTEFINIGRYLSFKYTFYFIIGKYTINAKQPKKF